MTMDEHEEISYKTLRRLQQAEQASSILTKINVNFYQDLSSYMKTLERSIENEKNPLKLKLFSDEIQNTKKIANSIYELREKKIVQAALATVRSATPDLKYFLDIEKKLYTALGGTDHSSLVKKSSKNQQTATKKNNHIATNRLINQKEIQIQIRSSVP